MHVKRLMIKNMRSIRKLELSLTEEETAGWHVILGDNGTGKTTLIRALAIALMGQSNADATRQDWSRWLPKNCDAGQVDVSVIGHNEDCWTGSGPKSDRIQSCAKIRMDAGKGGHSESRAVISFEDSRANRTIWGMGYGWFSASFGPVRRFFGGDKSMEKLFYSHPLLAPHLSVFGEDNVLGESLEWLQGLATKKLQQDDEAAEAAEILSTVIKFINETDLLPHRACIADVSFERIEIIDGHGSRVTINEISDGYRSMLSMILEVMRLLFWAFGTDTALKAINTGAGAIALPGVIAIDEVDAHLHPDWQQRIGDWFIARFPKMQFIVTTHSPIICRSARRGSVWELPVPDSDGELRRITGVDLARLVDGSILDAYGTELFGTDNTRSEQARKKLERLALLNRKRLRYRLSDREQHELDDLRAAMPSNPNATAAVQP